MKTNNVIQFPKDQSTRARLRDRAASQKALLAMSILAVLMVSAITNQWVTRPQIASSTNGGRGIASLGPSESTSDVRWEHELARQLSKDNGTAAHLAVRPSLRDELIFGSLEGRYGMKLKEGRVESLEFIDSSGTEKPLKISDRGVFLQRYRGVFTIAFNEAGLSSRDGQTEVWNLIGADRTIVGQARFHVDADERVSSIELQH